MLMNLPLSVISVLVEGYNSALILSVRNEPITSTTDEMNKTKRRGPRTEPCGMPVSEVTQEEDDKLILTKDEQFVKYDS